jgi:SAM-dependent methyltransferase
MPDRFTPPVNGTFKGRGRHYFTLLACPIDHAALVQDQDVVRCTADPSHVYPFENGVLRLAAPDHRAILAAHSDEHEARGTAQGWQSPDEAAFKALPQTGLGGYPDFFWPRYAAATALLWRFLEAIRLANGGLPIGPMGEAAIVNAGMGWLAYGLDVAGYTTLAIDAHAGPQFGLGVYPIARYMRVQADPVRPPLAHEALDLLIFQEGLSHFEDPAYAVQHAAQALRAGGILVVMDSLSAFENTYEQVRAQLEAAGLRLMQEPHRAGWRARLGSLREHLAGREAETPPLIVAQKPR